MSSYTFYALLTVWRGSIKNSYVVYLLKGGTKWDSWAKRFIPVIIWCCILLHRYIRIFVSFCPTLVSKNDCKIEHCPTVFFYTTVLFHPAVPVCLTVPFISPARLAHSVQLSFCPALLCVNWNQWGFRRCVSTINVDYLGLFIFEVNTTPEIFPRILNIIFRTSGHVVVDEIGADGSVVG